MEAPPFLIASRQDLNAAVEEKVEAGIQKALPEAIRRALQPEYLTKAKLKDLTGWSDRQIAYKRANREIDFIKRGRLILYPTEAIYRYLEEGHVPARKDVSK